MRIALKLITIVFSLSALSCLQAQESWDLGRCINHALDNNFQVKQAKIAAAIAGQDLLLSRGSVLPAINGLATHTYNFGQTIDPFTNQFATSRVQSNSFALSANMTLFSGLQQWNNIQRNKYLALAGAADAEQIKNDLAMSIATAYLQVIFAEEMVQNMRNQAGVTAALASRTKKLVEAGTLARGSLLDIEAQAATEELNVVTADNQLNLSVLNLKQLLDLTPETELKLVRPEVTAPAAESVLTTPGQVFDAAQRTLPGVKAAEYRTLSAEKSLRLARGGYSPNLSLSGSYGSGYSGLQQEVTGVKITGVDSIGFTSDLKTVYVPKYTTETQLKSFSDQIADNLNQTIGFRLTVPIFNGFSVRTNVSKARLAKEKADLDYLQYTNQLRKNIEQAHADAVAALKKFSATEKSLTALKESFGYMSQRFEVGMANSVEYTDAKNKMMRAESDLLQAKYDYLFKLKVLDYYQGKSLAF